MTRSPLTPHDRHAVLIVGRRVAAELAAVALDPASDLPWRVRAGLADIVCAVDVAACRVAGVEPPDAETRARLAAALPTAREAQPP